MVDAEEGADDGEEGGEGLDEAVLERAGGALPTEPWGRSMRRPKSRHLFPPFYRAWFNPLR